MSSRNPFEQIGPGIMRKINEHSATTYENNVRVHFDWENNTSESDPTGSCWATATLTWNQRIKQDWRHLMDTIVRDVLYPQYRSRRDGKDANDFLREINEEYDSIGITEISAIDPDGTNDDRVALMIAGGYDKEISYHGDEDDDEDEDEYDEIDFESGKGQTIKRELKRYVGDIMSKFMEAVLSPPDTPPQPVMTYHEDGDAILYDGGEYDSDEIDRGHDYKLKSTDVYKKIYWYDAIEGMVDDTFEVTFELVNNKGIPVSKGEDGFVFNQLKLKM